jgi:HipA-like protein
VSELLILIEGEVAGRVLADKSGRLSLTYDGTWLESPQSYSLSVNMPLGEVTYSQKSVWPHLWNLLPENPNVLQRWAQQSHVSAGNPFKILAHVGADVQPSTGTDRAIDGACPEDAPRPPTSSNPAFRDLMAWSRMNIYARTSRAA